MKVCIPTSYKTIMTIIEKETLTRWFYNNILLIESEHYAKLHLNQKTKDSICK